jgi:hypothetical protein
MNVNVLTNADFGYARGHFKLDKRVRSWMSFTGSYTFQVARGTDPIRSRICTSRGTSPRSRASRAAAGAAAH